MKLFKNIQLSSLMSKIISIFDMDNTLFETPEFAHLVKVDSNQMVNMDSNYKEYFMKVKSAFWDILSKDVEFKRSGDFIVPINKTTGKPFLDNILDYFIGNIEYKRMFLSQNGTIVLNAFPGFHKDPDTLGLDLNEPIFKEYEEAENKMILTGRGEEMRDRITKILRYIDMDFPNYGLCLYRHNSKANNIEQFKIITILNSIKEHGWDIVHFYEDRLDWLTAAKSAVNQTYPTVNFVAHFVTNIKNKRSL